VRYYQYLASVVGGGGIHKLFYFKQLGHLETKLDRNVQWIVFKKCMLILLIIITQKKQVAQRCQNVGHYHGNVN
jgi:hypothetical protein